MQSTLLLPMMLLIIALIIMFFIVGAVHAAGHILMARWYGVGVQSCTWGLGRTWWRYIDKKGTTWGIAWLPLGVYVRLYGQHIQQDQSVLEPLLVPQNLITQEKMHQADPLTKVAVALGGPLANFCLGFILLLSVLSSQKHIAPIAATPLPDTAAFAAGIQKSITIQAIHNGQDWQTTPTWRDVQVLLISARLKESTITLRDDNNIAPHNYFIQTAAARPQDLGKVFSYSSGLHPQMQHIDVREGFFCSSNALADKPTCLLQKKDRILPGADVPDITHLPTLLVNAARSQPLRLKVLRASRIIDLDIPTNQSLSKIAFFHVCKPIYREIHLSTSDIVTGAWQKSLDVFFDVINFSGSRNVMVNAEYMNIFSDEMSVARRLPDSMDAYWVNYAEVLALLSLLLASINMLPLPLLDGWQILLAACQGIYQKPLGLNFVLALQQFIFLSLMFMLFGSWLQSMV